MNNWRDIKKEVPKPGTIMVRVKYVYSLVSYPLWSPAFYDALCLGRITQNMSTMPNMPKFSYHLGIGIVHIDPPPIDDDFGLLSAGFRWSDLKGTYQRITHWMYTDEPYDESEETPDEVLLQDQDGNIKESTSVTVQEVVSKDSRVKKENDMKFVKTITNHVFDLSQFEIGAAYLCTPRDTSKTSFVGIYKEGGPILITFLIRSGGTHSLSIDDVMNDWVVEKMIDPMTDEELHFLQDILIKYTIGAFGANDGSNKHIIDGIMKKLGFTVEE